MESQVGLFTLGLLSLEGLDEVSVGSVHASNREIVITGHSALSHRKGEALRCVTFCSQSR